MSATGKPAAGVEDYRQPSQTEKLKNKIKDNPFVPIGVAGMAGAIGYGIWNFQHRGKKSASVYMMELRVRAQFMVVGAITVGVAASLLNEYVLKPRRELAAKKAPKHQ